MSDEASRLVQSADDKEFWDAPEGFAAKEREHASGWRVLRMAAWFGAAVLLWYGLINLWLVSANRWVGPS